MITPIGVDKTTTGSATGKSSKFSNQHLAHVLGVFFMRDRLGRVPVLSERSRACSLRRQRQPGRVQQVGSSCFQIECGTCSIFIS